MSAVIKFVKKTAFEQVFVNKTFNGPDWYVSFTYDDAGFDTQCPHKSYRVDVTVVDIYGAAVANAVINYSDKNLGSLDHDKTATTDKNGKATIYICGPQNRQKTNRTQINVSADGYRDATGLAKVSIDYTQEEKKEPLTCTVKMYPKELQWQSIYELPYDNLDFGEHYFAVSQNGTLYYRSSQNSTLVKLHENVSRVATCYSTSKVGFITNDGDAYFGYYSSGEFIYSKKMSNAIDIKLDFYGDKLYILDCNGDLYTTTQTNKPVLYKSNVQTLLSADRYIMSNGDVYNGSYKILENARFMDSGIDSKWILTNSNELYVLGCYGKKPDKEAYASVSSPTKVMDNVAKISVSLYSAMVLTNDGRVFVFGNNNYGQLGTGNTDIQYTLTEIPIIGIATDVYLDRSCSAIITSDNNSLYVAGKFSSNMSPIMSFTSRVTDNVKQIFSYGITYGRSYSVMYVLKNNGLLFRFNGSGASLIVCPEETSTESVAESCDVEANNEEILSSAAEFVSETKTYEGLIPNNIYNVYAMYSNKAESPFDSKNLIFIDQYKSDDNGCLEFTYYYPNNAAHDLIVKGLTDNPPKNAKITSAEVSGNSVTLNWDARDGSQKYRICMYKDGLAAPVGETEELTYTVKDLENGINYGFVIMTYIDGEWSDININDSIFVYVGASDFFEGWTDQDYIDYVNDFSESSEEVIILDENQLKAIEYVLSFDYDIAA